MNTSFHYLNGEQETQVAFTWVLVKLPPEYKRDLQSEISLPYGNTKMKKYSSFDSFSTTVVILSDSLLDSTDKSERKF